MKKTFRIKIKVRNCDIQFCEYLEPGVLGSKDLEFDLDEKDYSSPMFSKYLVDQKNQLMEDLVYPELEEIK